MGLSFSITARARNFTAGLHQRGANTQKPQRRASHRHRHRQRHCSRLHSNWRKNQLTTGKRAKPHTIAFITDFSERLASGVQISLDALNSYVDAGQQPLGANVDYGQALEFYEAEPIGPGRYSPPKGVRAERAIIGGTPYVVHILTNLVERQNLTMRVNIRWFTRLMNAFGKKLDDLQAAVGLRFARDNFVRLHSSLRTTPAMAAGVDNRLWSLEESVDVTNK